MVQLQVFHPSTSPREPSSARGAAQAQPLVAVENPRPNLLVAVQVLDRLVRSRVCQSSVHLPWCFIEVGVPVRLRVDHDFVD